MQTLNPVDVPPATFGAFVDAIHMSAQQYSSLKAHQRENIRSVTFIPPQLGETSFGCFLVRYRVPQYAG